MKYVFLLMRDTMREEHGGTTKNKMVLYDQQVL